MYSQENERNHSTLTHFSLFLLATLILGLAAGGYLFVKNRNNTSYEDQRSAASGDSSSGTSTAQGDATLKVQSIKSSTETNPENAVSNTPEPVAEETPQPENPRFNITDPNFSNTSLVTTLDPCKDGLTRESTTAIYTIGTATFTIHENFSANGCEGNVTPDAELTYAFASDGKSLKYTDLAEFPQCAKDQNPDCPKGDGKINIHIALRQDEDPALFKDSPLSGNYYFFEIEETNVTGDLTSQVNGLARLIESVILN